ncbi:MAG: HAMP domain-containing sensor histidine kinase [Planctomycetota bacterium]
MPATDRSLGWWGVFPPIECDSVRAWLPLSDVATIAVGQALSASPKGDGSDSVAVRQLLAGFRSDPPLQIFAALTWPGDRLVTAEELAQWFLTAAPSLFSGGDWLLAAPSVQVAHQRKWSRLMAAARRQDPMTWLHAAASWLRVLGASADVEWSVPTLIWDEETGPPPTHDGSRLLQRMARARTREQVLANNLSALANKRKLAAAKQLAYGLSHEINNPLANISARAQQLKHGESDPERAATLDRIVEQVYRAHEMISGLMFFANPPEPTFTRVDLNVLVTEAVEDFRETAADSDIRLIAELNHEAIASVDHAMMLEAIRVLVRNAVEAVDFGGTVVVSIESDEPAEGDPRWLIHIADSGTGLTAEESRHAFDPFYSGREAGRGLGLGLCRAYRVAKLHHATVELSGGLAGCVATISVLKSD